MARQLHDPIDGKYIVGDDNPHHFHDAHHYHVHDLHNEKTSCEIQKIINAGHVHLFDSLDTALGQGDYVRCEHCLNGQHCGK